MSYVIVSDVHLHNWSPFSTILENGMNSRLSAIISALESATSILKKNDRLYITGDLFHVRGHITPSVLNPTLDYFRKIIEHGIEVRIIPGNHDLESKNTAKLTNAVQALEALGCYICNEITYFEDDKVVMIPWIDHLDDLRRAIADQTSILGDKVSEATLMIHAPLNGVIPIPDNGLSPEELAAHGFKRVFCGHYHHHKEFEQGVFSVGALTHQTWSDVNTLAGYIFINNDDSLTHCRSSAPEFIDWDENWEEMDATEWCQGNYVRIKMGEATEKEIREIREYVMRECEALGCSIKSIPKPVGVTRKASVSSGASIEYSVEEWVNDNILGDLQTAVKSACSDVLKDVMSHA